MDYKVKLEVFEGPLDLLLYLIKRDEVDTLNTPIASVAEQFKHYLDLLTLIDVERAGDFLVMAATLMEIKSKLLLPRPEERTEEAVVAWTNNYNGKAKVFATTLGHNNETVADARYLDLVARGLLWSVGKLDEAHLKPAKKVLLDQ